MYILFFLFLIGAVLILTNFKKNRTILWLIRLCLILSLLLPFFLYFLISLLNIKLGTERNFFYLLPIYLLIASYGLNKMFARKIYCSIISVILLFLLLYSGIYAIIYWRIVNEQRFVVKYAEKMNFNPVILCTKHIIGIWPSEYYAIKYGIQKKTILVTGDCMSEKQKTLLLEEMEKVRMFALLQTTKNSMLVNENRLFLNTNKFSILKEEAHEIKAGPFQAFRRALGFKPHTLYVFFIKKNP